MTTKNYLKTIILTLTLILVAAMAACNSTTPTGEVPQPIETDTNIPASEEPSDTPSPTPTPELPVVVLAYGEGADAWTVERVQTILEELAPESSLGLEIQEGLAAEILDANVRVLVGISLEVDPTGLAGSNPGIAFVFVDHEGTTPANNLSVIGDSIIDQQRQSFMAGFLSALISTDYKVAGLIPAEDELSELMTDAFVTGVEFFCGVCNPIYPPYQNFPQWELISIENAAEGFQSVVDTLITENGVEVLYIQNRLASAEMLTYLGNQNVKIVGDQPPDTIRNNWVGTVATDPGPALIELWPDLLAGTGGVQLPSAITLTGTEAGLLSAGRLRLFEEMVDDLEAGLVSPETSP
ncbi:MAG: hypothetical protein ACOCYU_02495 [Brevefilum sp.]